jgi:nicotinamidase-related amidase
MESIKQKTALLVMDMQMGILSRYPDAGKLADIVAKGIAHARKNNIPVIYVVVGFRKGMPEISENNKGFSTIKGMMVDADMNEWMKALPAIAPQENEITVVKRRISAFTGSDLQVVLSGMNINHIVLTGVATSGVVLSTTREAADKDYRITILSDCCADADEEVHRVLIAKVFPRQADVMTLDEWKKI